MIVVVMEMVQNVLWMILSVRFVFNFFLLMIDGSRITSLRPV